jgi:hypothetical protein
MRSSHALEALTSALRASHQFVKQLQQTLGITWDYDLKIWCSKLILLKVFWAIDLLQSVNDHRTDVQDVGLSPWSILLSVLGS